MITLNLIGPAARRTERCVAQRLMLYPGELYRVPSTYRHIRVTAGSAYVTHAGQDIVIEPGQAVELAAARDIALVSALSNRPVAMELCAQPRRGSDVLML